MTLGSDEYAAALVPPQVTIKGRTYVGRILSLHEFAPFVGWFEKMQAGEITDVRQVAAIIEAYLRAVFPKRWVYAWQGDPVRALCALPWVDLQEVIKGFFACQAATMTPPARTRGPISSP